MSEDNSPRLLQRFLDREESVEQAYFFRAFRERLEQNVPAQDILSLLREEILATTKLPMAIDFLKGELMHYGRFSDGMSRLTHYFRPFQAYVMHCSELDDTRFDQRIAFEVLEREAEFLSQEQPKPQALFTYQFEAISRNRLGFQKGLEAMASDPHYGPAWSKWIRGIRPLLGMVEITDLIYFSSEFSAERAKRKTGKEFEQTFPLLFGVQEGRIAMANRGKDPLYLFAALQRHLDFPKVPYVPAKSLEHEFEPHVEARFAVLEERINLMEAEMKGQLDLKKYYAKPEKPPKFADEDFDKPLPGE